MRKDIIRSMPCYIVVSIFVFIQFFLIQFFADSVRAESFDVKKIEISGLVRVPEETALGNLKLQAGQLSAQEISDGVKSLYQSGSFKTVKAILNPSDSGLTLQIKVTELPTVRKVFIEGNDGLSEDDLDDVIAFDPGTFATKTKFEEARKKAEFLYQSKGYLDAKIDYKIVDSSSTQVDITFNVDEGKRFKISEVKFVGLKEVSETDLIGAIETKTYNFWISWLTGSGRLNQEILKNDKQLAKQFLYDNGFVDATVGDAAVERKNDELVISFDVSEGNKYDFGDITVVGDLIDDSQKETLDGINAEKGDVFKASYLREDSFVISEKFSDRGFAFVNVTPDTIIDRVNRTVGIQYTVTKGEPVYIRYLNISGNDKTYDNVIRREFTIQEGELYNGSKIKRSESLLKRLGYFQEVSVNTKPVDNSDKVDIDVGVREASTGTFSAGAGFATSAGALVNARISENNFLGTGRRVNLNVDVGTQQNSAIFEFYDRRLADSYWSGGLDIFRTGRQFADFNRNLTGAGFTVGYPLEQFFEGEWAHDISFSTRYEYVNSDINSVDPTSAADLIIRSEGQTTASGFTPRFTRNTIDNPLNPTSGSRQNLSLELTGFGGNQKYYLADASNQWYYPMLSGDWGNLTFSWRSRLSYGETLDDQSFPLYKRFFPGGINSVRGFRARRMGPRDANGSQYGGSKQFINNIETIFPLVNGAGLQGVVFFDIGEAFDDNQQISFSELRKAYGFGFRWASPMGPIRIEFGFPMDKRDGESSMVTLFSFGAPILN